FKIPRRGKIEYVSADPSSAYYQRLAETSLAATNGLPGPTYRARNGAAAVARLAGPPAVGGGVGPAAAAYAELAVGPALPDPLSAQYERAREDARRSSKPYLRYLKGVETLGQYSKGDVNENLYGTSAGRTPIGYVIGQMALAQGRLGPPLAPVAVAASWVGTATIY